MWSQEIPHGWVTGDDARGRHTRWRRQLRERGERYGLGVPYTTTMRDLEAPLPAYQGFGATHRGRQLTPALTLPQVRYGLCVWLRAAFLTRGVSNICRQVQRQ